MYIYIYIYIISLNSDAKFHDSTVQLAPSISEYRNSEGHLRPVKHL